MCIDLPQRTPESALDTREFFVGKATTNAWILRLECEASETCARLPHEVVQRSGMIATRRNGRQVCKFGCVGFPHSILPPTVEIGSARRTPHGFEIGSGVN